jgi:murein L,D-transpeptidase YcbB/YkuD
MAGSGALGGWRRGLLLVLAAIGIAASAPRAATQPKPLTETDVVARYLDAGGRIPPWARSSSIEAALADEAQRHGLAAAAAVAANDQLLPEARAMAVALRLARMLASGAVAPSSIQRSWTIPVPDFDPETALRALVSLDDPLPWLRGLAPQDEEYLRLQEALVRYAAIARQGGWPIVSPGPRLRVGMTGDRVATLRRRLAIEGDLAAGAAGVATFDADTAEAVRRFQERHGLAVDGQVDGETLAALNVDARQRYRQIAAALERRRWLPRHLSPERITVNAAAARLVLYEGARSALELRTIVGTPRHPTPVLAATIASLLFNPPWDIPPAIAANEILPHAHRDPAYLEREGIVRLGESRRLRQLPGPKNALGRIKFEMPNPLDVYLHDTPTRDLFDRTHRFFSHGCIRVEHPEALALRLLGRDAAWTAQAIADAIAAGATRRVAIAPIPVFVVYSTAAVAPSAAVTFYDDVYRRDPPLIRALFPADPSVAIVSAPASTGGCPRG